MSKNKEWIIDPKVSEFVNHLEGGLATAGFSFEDFSPQWVQLEHEDTKAEYNGLIFNQVPKGKDKEFNVCVAPDGIHFAGKNTSKFPFKFDQPPSKLAILFLVAIMQKNTIKPPSCPKCEEWKKWEDTNCPNCGEE